MLGVPMSYNFYYKIVRDRSSAYSYLFYSLLWSAFYGLYYPHLLLVANAARPPPKSHTFFE